MVAGATTAAMAGGRTRRCSSRGRARARGRGIGGPGGPLAHQERGEVDGEAGGGRERRREAKSGGTGGARFGRFEPSRRALVVGGGWERRGEAPWLLGRARGGAERRRRRALAGPGFGSGLTEKKGEVQGEGEDKGEREGGAAAVLSPGGASAAAGISSPGSTAGGLPGSSLPV
jgi:hypothetical protein